MNAYSEEAVKPTESFEFIYSRLPPSFLCSVVQVVAVYNIYDKLKLQILYSLKHF